MCSSTGEVCKRAGESQKEETERGLHFFEEERGEREEWHKKKEKKKAGEMIVHFL